MADQQPESARWFGRRLRELREAAGLTQQALAERVGVKWETISRWERGDREPSWGSVVALAAALGVDCTAFTQAPTAEPPAPKRGRPRKASESGPAQDPAGEVEAPAEKRTRKGRKKSQDHQ